MTNTQIDAFVFNPHRNSNGYVATGGIVTTAKWSGMPSWGYPGAKLFIAAARDNDGYPFQCMSVTHDGDVKVTHLTTTSGQTLLTSSDPIFTTDKITVGMPISNDYNDGSTLRSTIASRVDDFNIHTTDNATHSMTNAANLNVTWGSVYCHLDVDHLPTNFGGATRYVVVHPCPMWHGSGNTGCNWILELNNAAAQGKPIFSYVSRLYTGGGGYHFDYTDPDLPEVWGSPVQVTITTTVAGSGDFYAMEFDPGIPLVVQDDSNTVVPYKPIVNTAHAGARVIAPNVTPTGAQTGDSGLAISATNLWMSGGSRPYDATSAGSTVTVEVITNQGYDFGRTFTITFT
jgi:hypothetical protein